MKNLAFLVFFLALSGCVSNPTRPPPYVEVVVSTSEEAVDQADVVLARALSEAIERTEALDADLRDRALQPLLTAAEALERADMAARAARVALETWERTAATEGRHSLVCLVARISDLLVLMKDLGLPVPKELIVVVNYGGSLVGANCQ